MEIAIAAPQDAEGILECLRVAFEPYRAEYSAAGFDDTTLDRKSLRRRMRNMTVLVARDDSGAVIGTVAFSVQHGEGHLRGMAVRPEQQGRGVGKQLLRIAERMLLSQHCRRVTLDTTVPLQRAMRFYERSGYRASGRVSEFFGMPLYQYEKLLA